MDNGESSYRRFLDGDESGLTELIQAYKDGLIFYLNGFVQNYSVAEDLTEEVFVKLCIKKPHFASRSSFKTWLYAIGRNLALDETRKQAKNRTLSLEGAETDEAEALENAYFSEERKLTVRKAMASLKEEHRQVLWLVYFEGFSYAEIAKILKKSTHSVEMTASRARQALKNELIKEGFHDEDI